MKKEHLISSIMKNFSKLGIEGNVLCLIKDIYENPTANILVQDTGKE